MPRTTHLSIEPLECRAVPAVLGGANVTPVSGRPDGTAALYTVNPDGTAAAGPTLTPFPGFNGVVRSARGDVDGDGIEDTVFVTGPGTPIRFTVISGADNATVLILPTAPFPGSEDFAGGGFVAAANLDSFTSAYSSEAEVIVTPDQGGGPRVAIFSTAGGRQATLRSSFLGIDDPNFRGGARPAVGDVNRDGTPDLAVAAGFQGGPRVALFDGRAVLPYDFLVAGGNSRTFPPALTRLVNDFYAFPGSDAVNLRNGAYVAIGDVDGDGFGDLIFGGGPGGAPRVFVLSGALVSSGQVDAAYAAPVGNFYMGGLIGSRGGVRVATVDADGDNHADVLAGSGEGQGNAVLVMLGIRFGSGQSFFPYGYGVVLTEGVFVG